jgi:hypothetical protein
MLRMALGIAIGGGAGFAFGYFGRCASGACPLTSNPWIGAAVGAALGALIAGGR